MLSMPIVQMIQSPALLGLIRLPSGDHNGAFTRSGWVVTQCGTKFGPCQLLFPPLELACWP